MLVNKKIEIIIKLLSPFSHFGDENMGTMQILRTMKFYVNDSFLDIPVFSGNALRGILRRHIMKDFILSLDLNDEGISSKLYYLLFCGGSLEQGGRFSDIGKKREFRKLCPPISLFGTACYTDMLEGKIKVGISLPICKELVSYTKLESQISIYDMLQEVFYTRLDDLKSKIGRDEIEKNENPTQMKYEMQCLSAGTELQTKIQCVMLNEIEISCLSRTIKLLKENPFIGGKSGSGHGHAYINDNFCKENTDNLYMKFLKENKKEILKFIKNLI